MTSSNGNTFRVTGPLWEESTGHRWIPLTKASNAEFWCFLWSALEQTVEQPIKTPVIWDANPTQISLGETARWLQLQPSSAWPRRRKRSKMFFISRLSPCFAGVIWFPYDVILAKEKCGLDDGCTNLIFSTDDGCTRWWRWLHYFGRVIFDTHTADPLQANMLIGCMIVVKCDTCKISGAYAHLDCLTRTVGDIGNKHSMLVTRSYKERIFILFPP